MNSEAVSKPVPKSGDDFNIDDLDFELERSAQDFRSSQPNGSTVDDNPFESQSTDHDEFNSWDGDDIGESEIDSQETRLNSANNDQSGETKKGGMGVWYAIGGGLLLLFICCIGFVSWSLLGSGSSQQSARAPVASDFDRQMTPAGRADADISALTNALQPAAKGTAPSVPASGRQEVHQTLPSPTIASSTPPTAAARDIVVTYDPSATSAQSETETTNHASAENGSAPQLSDEEKMFDNLLNTAQAMDVPPDAIKIDQSVVAKKAEEQRRARLDSEVGAIRDSVNGMRTSVTALQTEISRLQESVTMSTDSQVALSQTVNDLQGAVSKMQGQQEKDIASLKQQIAEVAKKADLKAGASRADIAARPASVRQVAAAPAQPSIATPTAEQSAPASAATRSGGASSTAKMVAEPASYTVPRQMTPVTVQAPAAAPAAAGSSCAKSTVSTVWRVKGVNAVSAYLVREEDKQGQFVQLNVQVPGFGVVQGFDTKNRAVCTSEGIIRR